MSAARPIRTLNEAARHGFYVQVTCEPCNRDGLFASWELSYVMRRSRTISSLRFRCEKCGNRRLKKVLIDKDVAFPKKGAVIWTAIPVKR